MWAINQHHNFNSLKHKKENIKTHGSICTFPLFYQTLTTEACHIQWQLHILFEYVHFCLILIRFIFYVIQIFVRKKYYFKSVNVRLRILNIILLFQKIEQTNNVSTVSEVNKNRRIQTQNMQLSQPWW